MKMLLLALLVLAATAAVVSVPPEDNGYVLLSYGSWTVETSLVLFLILNLILFVVLYLAIRTLIRIWTMPRRIRGWKERRGARRARRALT